MISVTDLTKEYNKVKVLDQVSFTIDKGSIVGLIGSNGAGKSTLISILASIINPTKGSFTVGQERIAYVPQEITLFPNFTVQENLVFWDTLSGSHTAKKRRENIKEIASIAKVEDYLDKKVSKLSGGLKRRLNIAVALLSDPDILIMDEPTVGIDIESRAEIVSFIKNLASTGTTIIYVSHHPDEIEALCDQIIALNKGHLVFDGTLDELKRRFPHDNMYKIMLKISKESPNETHHSH